ncbi:MAG: signal peptidase I [Candidatus Levybacteria bacterium]|nr:signal peptidase I [Candidatus Levybacteria bacterium]
MFILRAIYAFFIDTIQTFLLAASVFLVIYIFVFRPFQVNGASMYPNFVDGEHVLTNLISIRFENPKKGEVIVFKAPRDEEKDFIKRVIGTPGDTVSVKNGDVYVDNEKLDQSGFLKDDIKTYSGSFLREGETITVPQDKYFVMGDNRPYSSDSREWGFVTKKEIIGQSLFVYWPFNKMRVIKNPFEK